jgi:hypothetical protein
LAGLAGLACATRIAGRSREPATRCRRNVVIADSRTRDGVKESEHELAAFARR